MTYEEYLKKESFTLQELIAHSYGRLVEDPPERLARLPTPPFLMIDRVTKMTREKKALIIAEQDIKLDAWYFQCHFKGDPVQPGALGVDAIWQLIGFYLSASGGMGTGRALGAGEVEFFGQIRPHNRIVRYEINMRRRTTMKTAGVTFGIGNGKLFVDDELIYTVKDAKVGLFRDIVYPDYPLLSKNAVGGAMSR